MVKKRKNFVLNNLELSDVVKMIRFGAKIVVGTPHGAVNVCAQLAQEG
jgi:hypothetical protein